ncbi:PstS family phosphate ABC transporter substrate-binding protein [Rhodopseudomonas palustris]|uniref:ABC-type phosphate transport system periplasmic component-like n=1 Tax=Rhodopseudomonas palustris (strain BisB18) TaxID=316056 RepID=Q217Z2_RHOPB
MLGALSVLIATAIVGPAGAELLRTGGTGSMARAMQRLGAAYRAEQPDSKLEFIPSLGSAGAIAAVIDGSLDFAITGRPANAKEAAHPLTTVLFARTPFGLVSSQPNPGNIRSNDIAGLFADPQSKWPDGTPVRVVLRPRSEVDAGLMDSTFPRLGAAVEQLRRHSEVPLAATDQDNVAMASRIAGSLAVVTLTQLLMEQPGLRFLSIDGVAPTLENFERGDYPYGKDIYLVFPLREQPALERFIAFMRSAEGDRLLRETGNLAARR